MTGDLRALFRDARTWVVKIGSSLLTDDGRGLDAAMIGRLAAQIAQLRKDGRQLVLVSSGAVAAGVARLGWPRRPTALPDLQAAAALGQSALIGAYEQAFSRHAVLPAQVLLGHDDVAARDRYLNARAALAALLRLGVVPVVNENDTVVTDEIRFGDNDTLAALVANLIDADVLVLLTDQAGLYERDPRHHPGAALVERRAATDPALDAMAGDGGRVGRGGMVTKVRAARLAARSGSETFIVDGRSDDVLERLASGERLGTWLESGQRPESARRQWLAGMLRVQGKLVIDDGAVRVLRESGRSLLPVGVCEVEGHFQRGDVVSCCARSGLEIGRGLSNYSAEEARRIAGRASSEIAATLGYGGDEEMIHRDNLVLVR